MFARAAGRTPLLRDKQALTRDERAARCARRRQPLRHPNRSVKLTTLEAMKRFVQLFAVVAGAWTLVALCSSGILYVINWMLDGHGELWLILKGQFTHYWIWAAMTPIVFLVARRFPLNGGHMALTVAVHAGCFVTLTLLHSLLAIVLHAPLQYVTPQYQGSLLALRYLENFYNDLWFYWPLVCVQALMDSQARTRERDRLAARLETELARARLDLLRAQIHPHFLFNTLHAISALIRIDWAAAEDMVSDLADLLRASFADPAMQETLLRREVALVRCYMRIQTRRFSDRLTVTYHVDAETLDGAVPVLVLQPLVENAVLHGVSPAERPCTVEISSIRHGDCLVLRVTDDGVGLLSPHSPGVGLSNIARRLAELYRDRQSFELTERNGGGTVATVRIPYRRLEPHQVQATEFDEDPIPDRG